ncbi:MAG: N-acyl homoserine lactonase family protein [Alphaproteobacteria bacterium]
MPDLPQYEVFAIKFGSVERRRSENFLGGDPHDGPMPLDYFLWAIRGAGRTFVIDTGFGEAEALKRNRHRLRDPSDGLRALGIEAAAVEDVVITHLHYDHAGSLDQFPRARFHVQDNEVAYATGRHMCHAAINRHYAVDDVVQMIRAVYAGRVSFHDGDATLAPGLSLHRIGGHTMGMQSVRVHTRRGWVVLASDASHLYANMEEGRPFPIVHNMTETIDGYATLRRLAESPKHVIPGHDPQVMTRYPSPSAALEGIAVRLDVEPSATP